MFLLDLYICLHYVRQLNTKLLNEEIIERTQENLQCLIVVRTRAGTFIQRIWLRNSWKCSSFPFGGDATLSRVPSQRWRGGGRGRAAPRGDLICCSPGASHLTFKRR